MSADKPFTKENLDSYLKELAKEFRKRNGTRISAEITLIGGASVLVNYGFREMTYDMDAIIHSSGAMKDAINIVGDRLGLPTGWLNADFMRTESYTPKLERFSKYYKTFSNILQIRTITAEYLVAMKLMSGRQYKNDLSDVVGIIIEQEDSGEPITIDIVKRAIVDLYDSYESIPEFSRRFIESVFKQNDIKSFYKQYRKNEMDNKDTLIKLQENYPGIMNGDNIADILEAARKKKHKKDL